MANRNENAADAPSVKLFTFSGGLDCGCGLSPLSAPPRRIMARLRAAGGYIALIQCYACTIVHWGRQVTASARPCYQGRDVLCTNS